MTQTQIADVNVPTAFQNYITENSLVSSALFQSDVAVQNGEMAAQLQAGAQSFTDPFWAMTLGRSGRTVYLAEKT